MKASEPAADDVAALLARLVRDVPDFPEPGVVFKDISPLVADYAGFRSVVAALARAGRDGQGRAAVDKVVGIEARGFILAAPVALALEAGFIPVRKAGKLPGPTLRESYTLEYGEAVLEMAEGAVAAGERVLVVDDVLATGGTAAATASLVRRAGGTVTAIAVLLELAFLHGREQVPDLPLVALGTV